MMYVHTGIYIKEVQKYQNIKLKTVTSVFFFSFGVQEAHMLSGNSQHITSMSSAVDSILTNRKIIWGTDSKGRQECDHKLVFSVAISVQKLNFSLAFVN